MFFDEQKTWLKQSGNWSLIWYSYTGILAAVSFSSFCSLSPVPLSLSLPLSRQEGLRGHRVVWLQSGWSPGRMPVTALMTLFSSGVQGVGVSGWTLPDGSWGQGPMPTIVCGKGNNWVKTASTNWTHTGTHLWQLTKENSLVLLPMGSYNLTMMRVKSKIWPYLDCGLFEIMKYYRWGFSMRFRSWPKLHHMKF